MISSPSAASRLSSKSADSDLLDQSALSALAQRLVEAAKRAGADAADAVAVRGVSQGVEVRDGRVEESERSEGDDVGLRVLVGRRQAVVSTNDISSDGVSKLAERAVAMARVAPDDQYVGLADPSLLAHEFPDLDMLDPVTPSVTELERRNESLRRVPVKRIPADAEVLRRLPDIHHLTQHRMDSTCHCQNPSGAPLTSRAHLFVPTPATPHNI